MPWRESLVAGIGGFIAIYLLAAASAGLGASLLIAPFEASCVLVFAIPQSPLAQPRNVIGGHLISTAAGLSVFWLLGPTPLAFSIGVGSAITAMSLTGTLHPPAGGSDRGDFCRGDLAVPFRARVGRNDLHRFC
jgi:CBS-domain-containing membrane protein